MNVKFKALFNSQQLGDLERLSYRSCNFPFPRREHASPRYKNRRPSVRLNVYLNKVVRGKTATADRMVSCPGTITGNFCSWLSRGVDNICIFIQFSVSRVVGCVKPGRPRYYYWLIHPRRREVCLSAHFSELVFHI